MAEFCAFRDLVLLLEENELEHTSSGLPDLDAPAPPTLVLPSRKFKLKSTKFPDLTTNPFVWTFLLATARSNYSISILHNLI